MVQLRYAADSKESDWLVRTCVQKQHIFSKPDSKERRLFFKLRGSTLTAHPEPSYPELWRSPVKELRSVEPQSQTFELRLDKVVISLRAETPDAFARWVDALNRSAGTSFERFYRRERCIGRGHFSQVYQASDRSTGDKFAVKVINKDKNDMEKSKKFIRREVKVLSITDHPNLVRAVDFFSHRGKPHIVLEYVEGGSLRELIRKKKRLSESEARPILRGILSAVSYLHSVNIVHRDIKPENVLMERQDLPKITDFGLATFVNEDKHIHSVVGTPSYVAPEVIRNVPYGPAADVWSCGVLLYFMLAGERPFTGDTREDIKRAVLAGDLKFPSQLFGRCSPEIKHLINLMLNYEQRLRISAENALQHPWLSR
ncbi:Protein kinase [Gracilaria domingensis]|nr:Protein kinase [Gracilaria domingensis]